MPSSSLKAQIAEIDSEIHLLAVKMAELRRRRNALMPFSTLPREIISKVLHHAVENAVVAVERQADNEGNYEVITGSIYDWTSITQFCMEWRLVALGQSTLWTQIRTTNSGWAKAFFQRSKDQLVCVDTSRGRTTDAEYDEVLRLVVSNMHRIRSLRLDANSVEERILWLRNISAPQLEVLKYSGELPESILSQSSPISPDIMPRLRQLQLKYCCIQDSDLILPSQLPTVTDISLICISVDDQVNILDRCKAIRRLSTSGSLSELTHPTPIILPDLEYLWYSHRHWSLLDYLTLPPESHLHILRAIDDATAFNLFTRFSQALNPQASVPDTPTRIHHLTLFYNKSRLGVHAKDGVDKDIATFGVQISLYNTDYPLFFASILALSQTATIGIQSMNINAPGQCSIFFSAFRRHHRIATIKIEGFPGISSLLAFPDIRNPACTTGQINPQGFTSRIHTSCGCKHCHDERVSSYPGLQTLILYLGLTDVNDEVPLGRNTSRPWSEMLLDWLGERKLKGLGLTNLELHCNLAENKEGLDKLSTRLRQVVTNVNVTVRTNMSGLPTSSVFPTPLYDSYRRRILLH